MTHKERSLLNIMPENRYFALVIMAMNYNIEMLKLALRHKEFIDVVDMEMLNNHKVIYDILSEYTDLTCKSDIMNIIKFM